MIRGSLKDDHGFFPMSDLNPAVAEQHAHDGVGGRVRDGEVQRRPALVVGPVDHAGVGVQQELDAPKGEW